MMLSKYKFLFLSGGERGFIKEVRQDNSQLPGGADDIVGRGAQIGGALKGVAG